MNSDTNQAGQRFAYLRCATAQVGFLARASVLRRVRAGVAGSRRQVAAHAAAWAANNAQVAAAADGPLWVVLGDSSAQAIGAASAHDGYVGQLRTLLEARDGRQWRVLNLAVSGARAADVADRQVPQLRQLDDTVELVTCAVGANDLLRTPASRLIAAFGRIVAGLPAGAVIATLPQGLALRRSRALNAWLRDAAVTADLRVADVWATTGPPWTGKFAPDLFHPNSRGYADWTAAFAQALGVPFGPAHAA